MTPPPTTTPADPIAPTDPSPTDSDPGTSSTVKTQLLAAIDRAPDSILLQVLNFLNFLLSQRQTESDAPWSPEFLSTFGSWEGELERHQPQWTEQDDAQNQSL